MLDMMPHTVYRAIVDAIDDGRLKEPFRSRDIIEACPNLDPLTCGNFLSKHAECNGKTSELFVRVSRGLYTLKRPRKYGF